MYFFSTDRITAREIFKAKHVKLTDDIFIFSNLYAAIANTSLTFVGKRKKGCFIFKIQLNKVEHKPFLDNTTIKIVSVESLEKQKLLLGREIMGYGYLPDCSIQNNLVQDARWMLVRNKFTDDEAKMINWRYFQPINQNNLNHYSLI